MENDKTLLHTEGDYNCPLPPPGNNIYSIDIDALDDMTGLDNSVFVIECDFVIKTNQAITLLEDGHYLIGINSTQADITVLSGYVKAGWITTEYTEDAGVYTYTVATSSSFTVDSVAALTELKLTAFTLLEGNSTFITDMDLTNINLSLYLPTVEINNRGLKVLTSPYSGIEASGDAVEVFGTLLATYFDPATFETTKYNIVEELQSLSDRIAALEP